MENMWERYIHIQHKAFYDREKYNMRLFRGMRNTTVAGQNFDSRLGRTADPGFFSLLAKMFDEIQARDTLWTSSHEPAMQARRPLFCSRLGCRPGLQR